MSIKELKLNIPLKPKDFERIYDLHFNALCAFAYKYLNDVLSVEDLVQEAFISLWEKRADFRDRMAIKSFLFTSVRNKCLNQLKHKKVKKKHEEHLVYELESEQFFTRAVIEEETFNRLYIEIENLPESARYIMLLALNGLKNPEIAEKLSVSVNTVKTQKKIAYSKLKSKLKPAQYGILLAF